MYPAAATHAQRCLQYNYGDILRQKTSRNTHAQKLQYSIDLTHLASTNNIIFISQSDQLTKDSLSTNPLISIKYNTVSAPLKIVFTLFGTKLQHTKLQVNAVSTMRKPNLVHPFKIFETFQMAF